jgi:hypothetical protein
MSSLPLLAIEHSYVHHISGGHQYSFEARTQACHSSNWHNSHFSNITARRLAWHSVRAVGYFSKRRSELLARQMHLIHSYQEQTRPSHDYAHWDFRILECSTRVPRCAQRPGTLLGTLSGFFVITGHCRSPCHSSLINASKDEGMVRFRHTLGRRISRLPSTLPARIRVQNRTELLH